MERLQQNPLKYGLCSVEVNRGRGKGAGGEISINFIEDRLTAMTLAFLVLVCLSKLHYFKWAKALSPAGKR